MLFLVAQIHERDLKSLVVDDASQLTAEGEIKINWDASQEFTNGSLSSRRISSHHAKIKIPSNFILLVFPIALISLQRRKI